ncbi:MAG: FHA domain-containing protein [Verrucomicrobiota bacterium]
MIQLKVLSGSTAGTEVVARRFPFSVGRNSSCDLQITDPGVWDEHFQIDLTLPEGFHLAAKANTVVVIDGKPIQKVILRNGEIIEIGTTKILFGFSATKQKGLAVREWLTWTALAALCLGQIALIYRLLR